MRNTQARGRAAEFRCQCPAAAPKFRCRPAGQILSKHMIYIRLSTLRGCLSGLQKRFLTELREKPGTIDGPRSYRSAAGVTTYRRAQITLECDMPSAEKIVELPLPAETVDEPDVVARFEIRYSRFL